MNHPLPAGKKERGKEGSKEQGARRKEQGDRSKEQGERSKEKNLKSFSTAK